MAHQQQPYDDPIYTYEMRNAPSYDEKTPSGYAPLAVPVPEWDDTSRPSQPNGNCTDSRVKQSSVASVRWWSWDILCALTAVGTLGAIVGVLYRYDGKPQDAWPSQVLTINGLMAILTTLCKGAFMTAVGSAISQAKWNQLTDPGSQLRNFATLDEASRGTWGSLQLFRKLPPVYIAYVGAFITVLSLGFETFLQQLVSVRVDQVPGGVNNPIGDVTRSNFVFTAYGTSNSWLPSVDTRMAIYDGFMSSDAPDPLVTCPTGNCTWPIVPTVGVCGRCVDLTDKIETNITDPLNGRCNLKLGPLNITNGYCRSDHLDFMQVFTLWRGPGLIFDSLADEHIQADSPNLIANFGAMGLPESKQLTHGLGNATATECALWYCLQSHNVSVERGELQDNTTKTWSKAVQLDGRQDNVTFTDIPDDMNVDPSETYEVSFYQIHGMKTYANKTFVGNVSADGTILGMGSTTDYADGLQKNFDRVDKWIEQLAKRLTNDVRMNGTAITGLGNALYRGTVFESQVFLEVTWAWVAFPAALVFMTLIYLLYEIVHTSGLNVQVWKSDALVPLYMNLGDDLASAAAPGTNEPKGIEKRIGQYRVQLDIRDDTLVGLKMQ